MKIHTKRIYDAPQPGDGQRILIDRLWPRGRSKSDAKVDLWMKDIAPSTDLRRWYGHDPEKWPEFKKRYFAELDANAGGVSALMSLVETGKITLLFGSREERLNNAAALKEYLEKRFGRGAASH
ncbi:MAG: DUF488 domain-containing protein [Lysobacterales bacterium]|nr:MAG: DUF488 domain-containing protein [Xanthomonadales bacterium]